MQGTNPRGCSWSRRSTQGECSPTWALVLRLTRSCSTSTPSSSNVSQSPFSLESQKLWALDKVRAHPIYLVTGITPALPECHVLYPPEGGVITCRNVYKAHPKSRLQNKSLNFITMITTLYLLLWIFSSLLSTYGHSREMISCFSSLPYRPHKVFLFFFVFLFFTERYQMLGKMHRYNIPIA